MLNITNIPAPRVEFVDPRTGLVSREWYRFLSNLFYLTGSGSNATTIPDLADEAAQVPDSVLISQIAELQKQLDTLKLQVYPQLGTFAALQQNNLPWTTFNPAPQYVPSTTTGTLYWNADDNAKTLNLVMEDTGDIVQEIGQKTYYRVKASSAITKGQVIMYDGTLGASGGLKAKPATGLTAFQNEYIMGIATQDIAKNDWGYVTWFGEIKKVNTTGAVYSETWANGDILYYSPLVAGGLTKNVPTAPNPKVIVASVVHAAINGIMFVRPTFGSALGATDSNVQITSLADKDILQYVAANSRWENVAASSLIVNTAPITKTANFTVNANETWFINNKTGATCVVTLPTASANVGRVLTFHNNQPQLLDSAASNVVPPGGGSVGTAILAANVGDWATLVSDGINWVNMQYGP